MEDGKDQATAAGSSGAAAARGSLSAEVAVAQPSKDDAPVREPKPDDADEARDYQCGVGSYRPAWLQRFATPRYYAFILATLGTCQGAYRMYMVSTLTTMEKRFSLSSKQTGFILIGDDVSPILANIVLILFLKRTSKPNWVSAGMMCCFIGTIFNLMPYVVYGPRGSFTGTSKTKTMDFCGYPDNSTSQAKCEEPSFWGTSAGPIMWFFFGNFLNGLGTTAYYTIGSTYMDDSVEKSHTAAYFGYVMVFRLIGPVLGYFLGFFTLKYPEEVTKKSHVEPGDPRWIGAWWLGYAFIATAIFLSTIPMILFPKKMHAGSEANREEVAVKTKLDSDFTELWRGLGRLARNPIYMFRLFHSIAGYIVAGGMSTTVSRYMEKQFAITASFSSLMTGIAGILSNVIGIFLGSAFVHILKPSPRAVGLEMTTVTGFNALLFLLLMGIRCDSISYPLTHAGADGLTILNECNEKCDCPTTVYRPVCDQETQTEYFSACYAGCPPSDANLTVFQDCQCLSPKHPAHNYNNHTVANRRCKPNCKCPLVLFVALFFLVNVLQGTTIVGTTLLLLRCIEPRDKSLAFNTYMLALTLFAFLPYPAIYGALTDFSCAVWEEKCGETGVCWIYDLDKMRYLITGFSSIMTFVSFFFLCIMTYYCKLIKNFHGESAKVDKAGSLYKSDNKYSSVVYKQEPIRPAASSKEASAEAHALDSESPAPDREANVHESEPTQSSQQGSRKPSIDGKELEKSSQGANIAT
ncbi:solute carrier organic anion transporter family member 74D-like [Dermacentor andersoni]|uniref:solute carrier organic anion transporter family member 74D-like n=1 Tax=Dermacentor andersoni TaxID=34620 RepID=UPI003B3B1E44